MKFPVLLRYPDFVIDPPPGPPSQNLYPIAQYLKVTAGHPGSRANQPRGIFEGGGIHPVWGTGGKSQLLGVRMMRDPHPHTMAKSPEKRLNHAASKITGLEKPLQIPGDPVMHGNFRGNSWALPNSPGNPVREKSRSFPSMHVSSHSMESYATSSLESGFRRSGYVKGKSPV